MERGTSSGIRTGIWGKLKLIPYLSYWKLFLIRVAESTGLVRNSDISRDLFKLYWSWGIIQRNELKICILPEAGRLENVVSGVPFISKLYSLFGGIDAEQTVALRQPFAYSIAKDAPLALKNPNGTGKYINHSLITFNANKAWSITSVFDYNGYNSVCYLIGLLTNANSQVRINVANRNNIYFKNTAGAAKEFGDHLSKTLGKTCIMTLQSNAGTQLSLYFNGSLFGTIDNGVTNELSINTYMQGQGGTTTPGCFYGHIIRAGNFTADQIIQEHNLLRSYFPIIQNVSIGNQVWATNNLDIIFTPQGNLIANVTDDTAWAASQTTYDTTYAATTGTVEQKTYAAVKAAAMWSYYNNDSSIGAIYGKLYNWFAVKLLQMDIDYYNAANPSTPWGWRIPTQADFTTLQTALGGESVAGGKMKKEGIVYWGGTNNGANNESGFSAIGASRRIGTNGAFDGVGTYFTMWSYEYSANSGYRFQIYNYDGTSLTATTLAKTYGTSVRLIKS